MTQQRLTLDRPDPVRLPICSQCQHCEQLSPVDESRCHAEFISPVSGDRVRLDASCMSMREQTGRCGIVGVLFRAVEINNGSET